MGRKDRTLLLVLHLASQELLWGPRQPNPRTAPSRGSHPCVLGPLARTGMINANLRGTDDLLTPSHWQTPTSDCLQMWWLQEKIYLVSIFKRCVNLKDSNVNTWSHNVLLKDGENWTQGDLLSNLSPCEPERLQRQSEGLPSLQRALHTPVGLRNTRDFASRAMSEFVMGKSKWGSNWIGLCQPIFTQSQVKTGFLNELTKGLKITNKSSHSHYICYLPFPTKD